MQEIPSDMPPVAASYEETWGSDGDVENGQAPLHKEQGSSQPRTPASPSVTAATSEGNEADTDTGYLPEVDRAALAESIVLQKTGWLVLRSTAKNLNNVLSNVGVTGLRAHQMYHSEIPPEWQVKCFILLYKWAPDRGDGLKWNPEKTPHTFARPAGPVVKVEDDSGRAGDMEEIMFCAQSMDNASATQAIVMSLMNLSEGGGGPASEPFRLGEELALLKAYMKPMDPVLRTAAICSSEVVRNAHNKAAREQPGGHPDLLDEDRRLQNIILADELWMYTVVVPGEGNRWVYELLGLSDEPKVLGFCDPYIMDSWTTLAMDSIEEKVATLQEHNTPFLLFAITSDMKRSSLPRVPRKTRSSADDIESSSGSEQVSSEDRKEDSSVDNRDSAGDIDSDKPENGDEVDEETIKEEVDRIRATHNYDTFFIEFMKLMASRGDLNALIREYPEYSDGLDETSEEVDMS